MHRALACFAALSVLILLAGCASSDPWFKPLPPGSLSGDRQMRHQVEITRPGEQKTIQTLLRVSPHRVMVVALSDAGHRLFIIRWRSVDDGPRYAFNENFSPRLDWLLNDLQLALWPVKRLRARLPAGFSLRETPGLRELHRKKKAIWRSRSSTPDPWQGTLLIENLERDYRLRLQPLAFAAVTPD